jgi:hypothetical protein
MKSAEIDLAAANHTGRELELMLARKKPLSMFYGEIGELPNEEVIPEARFAPFVERGQFVRGETTLELAYHPHWKRNVQVKYVFFAVSDEAWRIPAITLVLKSSLKIFRPDETSERLTSALLGYSDAEIDAQCNELFRSHAA